MVRPTPQSCSLLEIIYVFAKVAFEVGGEGGDVFVVEEVDHPFEVDGVEGGGGQRFLKLALVKLQYIC